jgi:anti-sigma-K factor RskA
MIAERQEELAALGAVDLLSPAEQAEFDAAVAADPALAALLASFRSTAAELAHSAPPVVPPALLKTRILASLSTQTSPGSARPSRGIVIPFTSWIGLAAAACFALTTAYFGQAFLTERASVAALRDQQTLAELALRGATNQLEAERLIGRRELAARDQRVTDLTRQLAAQGTLADYKIATLASLLGNSPQALAVAVWNPAKQEGVLTVQKLPALATDKDYQLWVVDPQYPIPVDGGVFRVDPATGEARLNFRPNLPVKTVAKFAVSLERKGGVPKAEGPMVLIGP